MYFVQRTRRTLAGVGLGRNEPGWASGAVVEAPTAHATRETLFDGSDVGYSSGGPFHLAYLGRDGRSHVSIPPGGDVGGWPRTTTRGGDTSDSARHREDGAVERTLGPPVHDRVRFATDRAALE